MKQAWLLLVIVSLAGCSNDPSQASDGASPSGGTVTQAPEWQVGQYWSYVNSTGGEFDLVVVDDLGGDWLLLNSNLVNALFDYQFDVSFIGEMRKSDLAGKQGNDRIKFFDFPLEHDKTWTTPWDGETITVVSHELDNPHGAFHIAATTSGGTQFAEFMYDPAVGFWTSAFFYDDNGEEQFSFTMTGNGDAYRGNVHRYTDVDEGAVSISTDGPANPSATLPVGEEVSEMIVVTVIDCGGQPGAIGMGMQEPQDDGTQQPIPPVLSAAGLGVDTAGHFGECPAASGTYEEDRIPPKPGVWRADGVIPLPGMHVDFDVTLRTYETFSF